MAELLDEQSQLESTTVGVFRTAATVKGGRRFSFSSLVVAGNRRGQVGIGYGKANQVPPAIEKAQKEARKSLLKIELHENTIPHEVTGRFGSSKVRLLPASPGTGVVAGAAVRAVLEMAGVSDCLTKCYGSTNKQNVVKATLNGLTQLRTREQLESLRGVSIGKTEVDERLERAELAVSGAQSRRRTAAPASDADQPEKQADTPSDTQQAETAPKAPEAGGSDA